MLARSPQPGPAQPRQSVPAVPQPLRGPCTPGGGRGGAARGLTQLVPRLPRAPEAGKATAGYAHLFCLYVSMASEMGSWWERLAPAMNWVTRPAMSTVSAGTGSGEGTECCWDSLRGAAGPVGPRSSPAAGGSALLNSSRHAVSRKRVLYLLSTEARYLARGWEPAGEKGDAGSRRGGAWGGGGGQARLAVALTQWHKQETKVVEPVGCLAGQLLHEEPEDHAQVALVPCHDHLHRGRHVGVTVTAARGRDGDRDGPLVAQRVARGHALPGQPSPARCCHSVPVSPGGTGALPGPSPQRQGAAGLSPSCTHYRWMRETVVLKAAWMSATEQVDTTSCLCARSCSLTYCQGREPGVKPSRGCPTGPHLPRPYWDGAGAPVPTARCTGGLPPPGHPWLLTRVSPLLPAPALVSEHSSHQPALARAQLSQEPGCAP